MMVSTGGFFKPVAIKRLDPESAQDADVIRFRHEAQILAQLTHPNTISLVDYGSIGGQPYIALEHFPGIPLRRLLAYTALNTANLRTLHWVRLASRIIADASQGLHATHQTKDDHGIPLGIVHNDISIDNISIGLDGTVKITGFSNASCRAWGTLGPQDWSSSAQRFFPAVAFEQAEHDPRNDQLGLGAALWQALSGRRFPSSAHLRGPDFKTGESPIIPPSAFNPAVPESLDQIVLRTLAQDPHARFKSTQDLALALMHALAELTPAHEAGALADWLEVHCHPDVERQKRLAIALTAREGFDGSTLIDSMELGDPPPSLHDASTHPEPLTPTASLRVRPLGAHGQPASPPLTSKLLLQASLRWLRTRLLKTSAVYISGLTSGLLIAILLSL
jgi:serine/threonine-protein kinase